jgi:ankyrin repeat protein
MKGGETVLMMAARSGSIEALKALLVRGAKHDARERRGQTALMWAAAEGHAAVVRALIEAGADINATLDSGFTPFFFAVREGRIEVVRALLEAGIKVNEPLRRREKTGDGPGPRHDPVVDGSAERPLRASDRARRRGCESQ